MSEVNDINNEPPQEEKTLSRRSSILSTDSSTSLFNNTKFINRTVTSSEHDHEFINPFNKRRSIGDTNDGTSHSERKQLIEKFRNDSIVVVAHVVGSVSAILPNVRIFINLISSLNNKNLRRNFTQAKNVNNLLIYFKFNTNNINIQHISESKSLYTCVVLYADQFLGYEVNYQEPSPSNVLQFTVDYHSLMTSLNMLNPSSSLKLYFDSEADTLLLEELSLNNFRKPNTNHYISCKIKTIQCNSFDMPIDIMNFELENTQSNIFNEHLSIQSQYFYTCIHDISSDNIDSKLILVINPDDGSTNSAFVMAKSQPGLNTQWNFRYDDNIFNTFNIRTNHQYYYSINLWAQIAKGVKNSNLVNIYIHNNGTLLLVVDGYDHSNVKMDTTKTSYKIYYHLNPIL